MNSKPIMLGLALLFLPSLSVLSQTFTRITTGAIVTDIENSWGSSWGDFDNDDYLDLFVANYGQNNFLYRNNGDGFFFKITTGIIVNDGGDSWGSTWGDYDNDDDLDLFVANFRGNNNFLYKNNGDGSFIKIVSGVVVQDGGNSTGASWGDFDNDGDLDLFVANSGFLTTSGQNNFLYENIGDGSFRKITTGVIVTDGGNSYGGSWGDFDNDGDLDLFVANSGQNNFLYENIGDGNFRKISTGVIVTDGGNSYGGSWGDFDNDGDLDLFVANSGQNNFLYENISDGSFRKITTGVIVTDGGNSRGASWGDYDNDGDLDLFVANYGQNNFLYENLGNGGFRKIVTGLIVNDGGNSIGSSWGDYDNDGDLDLFVANSEKNFLYQNNGSNNNWVTIKCVGTFSNRSAIGAKVRVKAMIGNKPVWQLAEISGQTGFGSQNSLLAEFGLGDATIIDSIRVEWPSGMVFDTAKVAIKQHITLTEDIPSRFVQANFAADVTKGVAPLTVHFMDRSVANPSITSRSWDFDNDGTIDSREQHPIHTYVHVGAYSVKLIVSNAAQIDSIIKEGFILVDQFTRITSGDVVNDMGRSSGCSWADYDNDGDLDLFVANRLDNFLYENNGDGTFSKITTGAIVNDGGLSVGSSWGDYDNDGGLDLFVSRNDNGLFGRDNSLYENNGDGTLSKINAGDIVNDGGISSGCSWGDYDNDSDLDLFVANVGDNFLYENNGNGTFTKIISGDVVSDGGRSNGAGWGDYDNDGLLDLFVANAGENNFLYHNNGNGSFTKITTGAIVNDGGNSSGGSWGDYDNDGFLDLFVANYGENNFLYRNNGNGTFTKIITGDIVNDGGNSRGASWGDYDNDGDLDLFVANAGESNFLYQNNGDGAFSKITIGDIVNDDGESRGCAWGDYDNDGDLDLFVASEEKNFLHRNNGFNNNWITIKCKGTFSNRSAIGARVQVKAIINNKSVWQTQEISGQTGFAGQNSLDAEFGLGDATIVDSLRIVWPSRNIYIATNLSVNQFVTIQEEPFSKITTGDIANDQGNSEGSSWGDYDNDCDLDLFVANEEENNFLYQNNGDGTFSKITNGDIVNDGGASVSSSWGDYDNDGDLDLFVANAGENNFLYENNGDGSFSKITEGDIVNDGGESEGCSWGDYDNDGNLDLFVANDGENNFLYKNNGDGSFTRITTGAIVNDGGSSASGSWGDYDNDGDLDFFVANSSREANFLYENNGDGTFSKITTGEIVNDSAISSESGSWGDYDNDGDLDLFVANFGDDFLYENNGDGTFSKIRSGDIVRDGGSSVSSSWCDYDKDGDLDLLVINNGTDDFLYQNNGDGTFSKITTSSIVSNGNNSTSWADYDNDGDLDLFAANGVQKNSLNKNNGFRNNWITIRCVGTFSNRSAIGAKVRVKAVIFNKPVWQMLEISGQTGRASQNSLEVEFGFGNATSIDSIMVAWPSRTNQVLTNVSVNQLLRVIEIMPFDAEHTPLSTAEAANDILLAATVKGDVISEVSLNYRQGGESRYIRVPMSDIEDSGTFQGRIPGGEVTANGLEYHIIASDIHGNRERMPSIGHYSIQVRVAEGISRGRSQPGGTTSSNYRLVSIPLNLDDKNPKAVLEDDLGKYNTKEWRFYALRDDYLMLPSGSSIYTEFPNTSVMTPGKAFWLTVKKEGKIINTGAGVSNSTNVDYPVPLHPGWNFIGNPFNFPIPIENLRLKSGEPLQLRTFSGDWNDPVKNPNPVPRILPFDGYAVFNDSTEHVAFDTLLINPDVTSLSRSIAKSSQSPEKDISWSIRIVAKCQEAQDSDNVLALAKGASERWDKLDLPEPPVIGEYVSAYFTHPEWKKLAKNFCTDFRPSGSSGVIWEFEIKTNINDKVNVAFESITDVPEEFQVWLLDEALKISQNLREHNDYTVAGSEHPKSLKLVVGKKDFIKEKLAQTQLIPTHYELSQNFPNPFNPVTTIRYGLPQAGRVSLKIYNLLGEELVALVDDEHKAAGYHVAIWEGKNKNGVYVTSGVYVYRLRAGGIAMTKKLAIIK